MASFVLIYAKEYQIINFIKDPHLYGYKLIIDSLIKLSIILEPYMIKIYQKYIYKSKIYVLFI